MAATAPTLTAPRTDVMAAVARLRALSQVMQSRLQAEEQARGFWRIAMDSPDATQGDRQQATTEKLDAEYRYTQAAEEYRLAMSDFELQHITRPAWPMRRAG